MPDMTCEDYRTGNSPAYLPWDWSIFHYSTARRICMYHARNNVYAYGGICSYNLNKFRTSCQMSCLAEQIDVSEHVPRHQRISCVPRQTCLHIQVDIYQARDHLKAMNFFILSSELHLTNPKTYSIPISCDSHSDTRSTHHLGIKINDWGGCDWHGSVQRKRQDLPSPDRVDAGASTTGKTFHPPRAFLHFLILFSRTSRGHKAQISVSSLNGSHHPVAEPSKTFELTFVKPILHFMMDNWNLYVAVEQVLVIVQLFGFSSGFDLASMDYGNSGGSGFVVSGNSSSSPQQTV